MAMPGYFIVAAWSEPCNFGLWSCNEKLKIPKIIMIQNVQPSRMAFRRTGVRIMPCQLQSKSRSNRPRRRSLASNHHGIKGSHLTFSFSDDAALFLTFSSPCLPSRMRAYGQFVYPRPSSQS